MHDTYRNMRNGSKALCSRATNLPLRITICHYSASLVMTIGGPRGRFFYPTLTLMIDSYNISGVDTKLHERYTKVQNMQIDMSFVFKFRICQHSQRRIKETQLLH